MLSICFCSCSMATFFVLSASKDTRQHEESQVTGLWRKHAAMHRGSIYLSSPSSSLAGPAGRSSPPAGALPAAYTLLWTPWSDLLSEAAPVCMVAIYPSLSLSLTRTLPLIHPNREKQWSPKPLSWNNGPTSEEFLVWLHMWRGEQVEEGRRGQTVWGSSSKFKKQ